MCTVTIIPKGKNGFILTSNRDEAPNRVSLPPDFYNIHDAKVLYPKDVLSGGTWIGLSDKNRLICVLNGGFVYHERLPEYRMSRGVVAKDFMVTENIIDTIETYNLKDIEPFTMVIADWNDDLKFFELVWDGNKRHATELPKEPKLWSSSTLYTREMKVERQNWFEAFKSENELDAKTVLQFHKKAGEPNNDYGVVMNRGFVKTTSITQVEKRGNAADMYYESLQDNTVTNKAFSLPQIVNE
ncbi:NRDE family protein [Flavivirga aquimarina]|uniref:NRDE family protein n=1 Tax=Flavivirga aquimarina TaxID=2027862 RepID=A0ABT8WF21_9FLAO|nr:NRDE family protein [Flavivirga aquimarina]MDO5971606.1 NRDE family protein [Flavivirga aquimarina]